MKRSLVMALLIAWLLQGPSAALAAPVPMSPGCQAANNPDLDETSLRAFHEISGYFNETEVLTITVDFDDAFEENRAVLAMRWGGSTTILSSLTSDGTMIHVFTGHQVVNGHPATSVGWEALESHGLALVTVTVSCEAPNTVEGTLGDHADEMFFYRSGDGAFRYYDIGANGKLGAPLNWGTGYPLRWDSFVGVDLDHDGQDELLYYRKDDGAYFYRNVYPNGTLGEYISSSNWEWLWDAITSIDLDGDGDDEMLFYRYSFDPAFGYYELNSDGSRGASILIGSGYSSGWNSISAVDLDGDSQDEIFFYRSSDGAFRYYDIHANGQLGAPILGGTGYSRGWDSISAVDLDGDGQDEMFFYRSSDGAFRYYQINPNGTLGAPIIGGTGYSSGWSAITAIQLDQ